MKEAKNMGVVTTFEKKLPQKAPPQGGTAVGTGAAVLCPCTASSRPHHPRTGALPIAALLDGGGMPGYLSCGSIDP
jgi:hypothetical protein